MPSRKSYQEIRSSDEDEEVPNEVSSIKRWWFLWVSIAGIVLLGLVVLALFFTGTIGPNKLVDHSAQSNESQLLDETCSTNCCQTESCRNYSQALFSHMDLSADPCTDFHQYVCGNWKEGSQFGYLIGNAAFTVGEALEDRSTISGNSSKAVQYAAALFDEFGKTNWREYLGAEPVQQLLEQMLGHAKWPLIAKHNFPLFRNSTQNYNKISNEFSQFWKSENSSQARESIKRSELSEFENFWKSWKLWKLSDMVQLDDQPDVKKWMDYYVEASMVDVHCLIDDIVTLNTTSWKWQANHIVLSRATTVNDDWSELFSNFKQIKQLCSLFFNIDRWNAAMDHAIFEVIDFDLKLSQILKPKSELELQEFVPQTISLSDLKNVHSSSAFDWTLLLNKFANRTGSPHRYSDEDSVYVNVDQLHAFKPFTELIANTPIRVLKNSIAFQVIRDGSIRSLLDEKYQKTSSEISDFKQITTMKLFDGLSFVLDRHNDLILYPIFARLYIDKVGREQMRTARDHVVQLVAHLKASFTDSLKHEYSWLDQHTRQNAMNKLANLKSMISFPDWIFDDYALDQHFGLEMDNSIDSQQFIEGEYATSYLNLRRLIKSAKVRKIFDDQTGQDDRLFQFYFMDPAGYIPEINSLLTSFYFLTEPFFSLDYPAALNFGSLGSTIGHEMTHAFDSEGRLYDAYGQEVNWLTDSASEQFVERSKCFVQQYNGLLDPITGVKINGTLKLAENIADLGGLNVAYGAFSKLLSSNSTCDWSCRSFQTKFTPEQLFFISYGKNWCSKEENSTEHFNSVQSGQHSPTSLRMTVPLSNMAQFAQAFSCPVGSKMNPEHKCSLW